MWGRFPLSGGKCPAGTKGVGTGGAKRRMRRRPKAFELWRVSAKQRLPLVTKGPIPPIRGKCPEGTKRVGMLSAKLTERIRTLLFRLYQRWNEIGQRIRILRIRIGTVRFAAPLLRNSSVAFGDSSFYTKEPLDRANVATSQNVPLSSSSVTFGDSFPSRGSLRPA